MITSSMTFEPTVNQGPFALVSGSSTEPPLLTSVPLATPPFLTSSKPPSLITAPLATAPDPTKKAPPLLTTVPLATPPEKTSSKPPLLIVVALAVPPADTTSSEGNKPLKQKLPASEVAIALPTD